MYEKILVATDGSKLSKKASSTAIELAALCSAALIAVKIVDRYPKSYFEGGITLSESEVKKIEQNWIETAQSDVDAVKKAALTNGVACKALVVKSNLVSEAILAIAKKQQCDLIVMASHGRKGLQRLLLGSEAQHVLTHASVPVLILK
jgi:nucleotide-binding universal stress UspA family protein